MKFLVLTSWIFCCACSHSAPTSPHQEDASLGQLNQSDAVTNLEDTLVELQKVDERIRSAQTRRDNYQLQAGSDVTKQSAVEGTEAELEALQTKRGALLHRQHVLEARLRELGANGKIPTGEPDENDEHENGPY